MIVDGQELAKFVVLLLNEPYFSLYITQLLPVIVSWNRWFLFTVTSRLQVMVQISTLLTLCWLYYLNLVLLIHINFSPAVVHMVKLNGRTPPRLLLGEE